LSSRRAQRDRPQEDPIATIDEDRVHEDLAEGECRRLLEKSAVGRLAFSHAALPAILPVSYIVHDGQVVITAQHGGSVARALRSAVVAFGVDSWDAETRTGWSVTVIGPTRVVSTREEVARLDALPASVLPRAADSCYVALLIQLLHGWRTTHPSTSAPHPSPGPRHR
jgi:hypothetical protein